ncbi:MAG: inositol monophosphatase family protein [Ferrimicrobium sp.]
MLDPWLVLTLVDATIEETSGIDSSPWEKSSGEWVTERDVAIESMMKARLEPLIPGCRILGEEWATHDRMWPSWIGHGPVWVIDPIDGTANYVTGVGPIATMVGLVMDGSPSLSCIRLHNGPALIADSSSVMVVDQPSQSAARRARSRGMVSSRFLPSAVAERFVGALSDDFDILEGSGCAGSDYLELVSGTVDFLIYERVLPWDHVPGAYAATVWGASARMGDGSLYQAQPEGVGLVVSREEALTQRLLGLRRAALRAEPYGQGCPSRNVVDDS